MGQGADPGPLGPRLRGEFFARGTRVVAAELLGCTLMHEGVGGVIVETEAYEEHEPACHAYVGRTARTAVLFGPPGRAYVYVCYGIHRMFNVVAEADGVAGAVLVRALRPTRGIEEMRLRRPRAGTGDRGLCSGPGKICEALAIRRSQTDQSLEDGPIAIHAASAGDRPPAVVTGPRIGLTKAADLPWRYCERGSPYLSRPIEVTEGAV